MTFARHFTAAHRTVVISYLTYLKIYSKCSIWSCQWDEEGMNFKSFIMRSVLVCYLNKSSYCTYMYTVRMTFMIILLYTTGVPGRPEITGITKPATEGDIITLTCTTLGSKPAANIRWFRNDKEVQGERFVVDFTELHLQLALVPSWRHHHCRVIQLLHPSSLTDTTFRWFSV